MTLRIIGLTGGIGAGKSTVAGLLRKRGAHVVDVDALGREVIAPGGAAVDAVITRFGETVRADDGSIDRAGLAGIVFGDPAALEALNVISHPAINTLLDERIGAIEASDPDAVVVLDMAVLTESTLGRNTTYPYQQVLVVEAPTEVRLERLIERGHTADDAQARMASQTGDHERRAIADAVIINDGDLDELDAALDVAWSQLGIS